MSKHERMDAIERRLAYLEANLAGEAPDDDPRYSCTPETMHRSEDPLTWPMVLPDEVREAAIERAQLADALAHDAVAAAAAADGPLWGSSEHFQSLVTRQCTAHKTVERYEASLRALQQMHASVQGPDSADVWSLIDGCLGGATITSEGLQRD